MHDCTVIMIGSADNVLGYVKMVRVFLFFWGGKVMNGLCLLKVPHYAFSDITFRLVCNRAVCECQRSESFKDQSAR